MESLVPGRVRSVEHVPADVPVGLHLCYGDYGHEHFKQPEQAIPPLSQPNRDDDWNNVEEGYKYGVGARSQYGAQYSQWDDRVESKLREEWSDLKAGRTWDEVKAAVRGGWETSRATHPTVGHGVDPAASPISW